MSLTKIIRDIQVKFEAIPAPSAILYNALIKRILSRPELKIAQEISQKIEKGILIDLGSGTGFLSIEIAKRAPLLNIYGIDLSRKMVEIASSNARSFKNVKFKFANAMNIPFETNFVDLIVSTGSFHHWKHPFKVFNECYRILKPDCEAWIYDGCSNPPKDEILKLKQQYGVFKYLFFSQIQKAHGFPWKIYNTKIKRLLEHTKFKHNFQMILSDGWMKIILKK
ncbi:MAG: methyltransferase domain-containing protein [Promethearchaeota archaeon]|nr:MAG: methyltransferase domain-containing protein [Candidatus Lokiarchaeota archaeon]